MDKNGKRQNVVMGSFLEGFLAFVVLLLLLAYCALGQDRLTEECFEPHLSSSFGGRINLLNPALNPLLRKSFLPNQKSLQCFLINLFLKFDLNFLQDIRVLEQVTDLLVIEFFLFWDLVFLFLAVLLFAMFQDFFDIVELLYELVSFHRADAFDFRSVIATAKDTHIDEFLLSQPKAFDDFLPRYFDNGLLFIIQFTEKKLSPEHKRVCILGAYGIHFANFIQIAALSLCFTWSLDNWNSHQGKHFLDILLLLVSDVGCPLLLLQSFIQITNLFSFLLLLHRFLLNPLPPQNLPILLLRRRPIENPHRLDPILKQQQRPIEKPQKMASLVPIFIGQFGKEMRIRGNPLRGDQELVH